MAETIKFSILGTDQIAMKLKAVSADARYRGGRFALRKAALVLERHVHDNAARVDDPTTENAIQLNVATRWNGKLHEATGNLGFRVGVRGGAGGNKPKGFFSGNPGGDTRYWRHLEFGTSKMPAQPFMRRALSENINQITNTFASEFGAALTRAIKRANT